MADVKMAAPMATNPKTAAAAGKPVLAVENLKAWYGESHILHGINFHVNAGEVVTLLGRNRAGKTPPLKSVMGIIGKGTGSTRFHDPDISQKSSGQYGRLGAAFCPPEAGSMP